nr:ankyrin repeat-containing protein ITN1-like [Tanacetum cinerariifolium]
RKKEVAMENVHQSLYEATLRQNFQDVHDIFIDNYKLKVSSKITINGNTSLHVAVGNTKVKKMGFLNEMLNLVENESELKVKNTDGSTLLHVAAIVGNTEAARMLVEKNKDLLFEKDHQGHIPLFTALSNMHTDTYLFLLEHHLTSDDMEMGTNGDVLMYNAISSRDYNLHVNEEVTEMDKLNPSTQENLVIQSVISTHEEIEEEEDNDGVDDDDHDGEEDDNKEEEQGNRKKEVAMENVHQSLYEATLRQNFQDVHDILIDNYKLKVSSKITINGNTALHVAVGNTKVKKMGFLNEMLNLVENESELKVKNTDGNTYLFLLEHHLTSDDMEMGTNGDVLMYNAISSRDY